MVIEQLKHAIWFSAMISFSIFAFGPHAFADGDNGMKILHVNCAKRNSSIQKAVNRAKIGTRTKILISGECQENVLIEKDDVTLSGNKNNNYSIGGRINGTITVAGGRRIIIKYLHITKPGPGIVVTNGASVTIAHNDLNKNVDANAAGDCDTELNAEVVLGAGIVVNDGASATIEYNRLIENCGDGVTVSNGGTARLKFNEFKQNGRGPPIFEAGIDVFDNGTVESVGNKIEVANDNWAAVQVGNFSYFRSGRIAAFPALPEEADMITAKENGTFAVVCYRSGTCDFRNADIIGLISISGHSNFDVRSDVTINGDVSGSEGSLLKLRAGVLESGTLSCDSGAFATGAIECGDSF